VFRNSCCSLHFTCKARGFEVAMLGSNQRPLPCEGRVMMPRFSTIVHKYLQNSKFFLNACCACSPLFAWVGVLLVYLVY